MDVVRQEASEAGSSCDNCGASLQGAFCHHCGAAELGSRDLSLRHFAAEASQELLNLEHSKLLRTGQGLLFRPGRLTLDYFSARRVRYLRPLTLCLAILALHLFAYSVSDTVSMFDIGRTDAMAKEQAKGGGIPAEAFISARIERKAAENGTTAALLEESINDRWARNSSLSQIPLIILMALVLKLAHLRSRRYFVEHLVFSMHFISFQVLVQVLMWPLYYWYGIVYSAPIAVAAAAMYAVNIVYLLVAVRLFYGHSWKGALLRAPIIFGGYVLIFLAMYMISMQLALRSVLGD